MRSEQTRSNNSRHIASMMILLASGLACAASESSSVTADSTSLIGPNVQVISNTSLYGKPLQAITVNDTQAAVSFGTVENIYGHKSKYLFRNKVVVQSTDWESVQSIIDSIPGATLGKTLGNKGKFRVVEVSTVGAAFEVQEALRMSQSVKTAEVDSGKVKSYEQFERFAAALNAHANGNNEPTSGSYSSDQTPNGAQAHDDFVSPQVLPSFQWNFTNDGLAAPIPGDWAGFDNNILESIYSTQMLSGAGVVVGVSTSFANSHLDVDHTELINPGVRTGGYIHDLSMLSDPALADDDALTGLAGIVAAERDAVGVDFQGVAPSAGVVTFYNGPTPLAEYEGFLWKLADVGVKVHNLSTEFDTPGARLNETGGAEYVTDAFKNSLLFGRRGKGTIHIFDTGAGFNFLPDPYNPFITSLPAPMTFPSEPWDGVALNPNVIGVTISNSFISLRNGDHGALPDPMVTPIFRNTADDFFYEQLYVGGQTSMYPIANDHDSLIINTISEDGNVDSIGAVGPGVFASVYAGSSNELFSLNRSVSGRGIVTTGPADSLVQMPDSFFTDPGGIVNSTATGAATVGGIVALMLEANPRLRVRDIQHILFESIQDSQKADGIKWPHFTTTRGYFSPGQPVGTNSFWQLNSGFYNNDDVVPPIVNQTIRHSDQFGFGVVDADIAVQKAATWGGLPQLVLLDTGLVGDVNLEGIEPVEDPRVPVEIVDATLTPPVEADASGTIGTTTLIPSMGGFINFCVRDNIRIESIVVELTIEGQGSNDLFITLRSPNNTVSNLVYPTTLNFSGQTTDALNDDEMDEPFNSGETNGTAYAYYQHPFLTHKHWGELSGGQWSISIDDYGVDEMNPEGAEPGDPMAMPPEPGADMEITLGDIGVPGSTIRSEKTVTAFRVRIYGTDTSADPFFGCNPGETSCPGDLNADGMVDTADLLLFIQWYQLGDFRADMNFDGTIDFGDILAFRGIFTPGPCNTGSDGNIIGGRPRPDTTNGSDTNPTTRPI